MDAINLLEKRIEAIELQVLPKDRTRELKEGNTISDLLLQTHTMITSALSCREAITSILQHMETINDYLDPRNGENILEVEAKRHYLLELYPELKNTIQLIGTFESLIPYMDSATILKVTQLSDKLDQLTITNLGTYDESREVTQNVFKCLQQYNDITCSIKILFAQLDTTISKLENALEPKFFTEE